MHNVQVASLSLRLPYNPDVPLARSACVSYVRWHTGRGLLASPRQLGVSELCTKYNMDPKKQPASLYDTFLFNDELDMLEERPLFSYSCCKIGHQEYCIESSYGRLHSVHGAILPMRKLPISASGARHLAVLAWAATQAAAIRS